MKTPSNGSKTASRYITRLESPTAANTQTSSGVKQQIAAMIAPIIPVLVSLLMDTFYALSV